MGEKEYQRKGRKEGDEKREEEERIREEQGSRKEQMKMERREIVIGIKEY